MLDNDNAVALGLERTEDSNKSFGIAGMQADRGFIQDIAYARQTSSHAGCQADALQFATAEGLTRTVQREIPQTDLSSAARIL